jgi:CheY-like chemotaxis protein
MNLCTNAAHAMMQRSGRLTVQLKPRPLDAAACFTLPGLAPGRYALLTVADTGHGMEASVLARIFEPFFTTKGPGEGTGLGLPMVHGIMQDHDGGIFVQSSPGVGTTFELYFPEAMESGVPQATVNTEIVPGRGESVLVVDDEESICRAIGAMLRKIGYHVETFTDPRLALERSRGAPAAFNLLLTDRTMPQLSGPQLIARIRESCPGLPVLLMSGLGSPPDHEGGAQAVYQLVAKPIDIAELSRAVRQALLAKSIC